MLISKETKKVLVKRFKSLLWRTGAYVVVVILNYVATNLELFNLPPEAIVAIAFVAGEITKYINKNLPELKKAKVAG